MTTVTELKALYVKLGGDAADVATIQTDAEMIEKIKEVAIPAELPSVTSEDNGDVLGVVEGAWAKMDAPAAPNEIVYYEATQASSAVMLSNNKTIGDIKNDIDSGKYVILKIVDRYFNLTEKSNSNIYFDCIELSSTSLACKNAKFSTGNLSATSGTWTSKVIDIT